MPEVEPIVGTVVQPSGAHRSAVPAVEMNCRRFIDTSALKESGRREALAPRLRAHTDSVYSTGFSSK